MLKLSWSKSDDVRWFELESVDLSNVHITGVYIIWHAGQASKVVRIGGGDIAARLLAHRSDGAISGYKAQASSWSLGPRFLLINWTGSRAISWTSGSH